MLVYRVCSAKYPNLDGAGAHLSGGRWNNPGLAIVYTASSVSLAILETRVHLRTMPLNYVRMTIEIADQAPIVDGRVNLPAGWQHNPVVTRMYGDEHFGMHADSAFIVPSVVVDTDWNLLFTPEFAAKHAHVVGQEPVAFDVRLWAV